LGRDPFAVALEAIVVTVFFGFAHGAQSVADILDNVAAGLLFAIV
jgi:hypothetical protein